MADFGFANKSNSSDFSSTGDKVNEVFGDLLLNRTELEAMITSLKRRQYGATPPANPNTGDIWECSTTGGGYTANVVYRYNGSAWAELIASAVNIPNRNTVIQGKVTAAGLPDLFESGTGLAVKLNATATPAIFAFMNGNSTSLGTVDIVAAVSADAATFWSSLPTSSTVYLYVDYTTGTVSGGFTTIAPVYQNNAPTHSAGLHWLDFNTGKVWSSDGSAWTQKNRVFVGTAATDGSGVTAVDVYRYEIVQSVTANDIITKGPWVDVRGFPRAEGEIDDTNRLQRAIDSFVGNIAGTVLIPCALYVSGAITCTKTGLRLMGLGNKVSRIISSFSGVTLTIKPLYNGNPYTNTGYCKFFADNISIEATGAATETGTGMFIQWVYACSYHNLLTSGFKKHIVLKGSHLNTFFNLYQSNSDASILELDIHNRGVAMQSDGELDVAGESVSSNNHIIGGWLNNSSYDFTYMPGTIVEKMDFEPTSNSVVTGDGAIFKDCRFERFDYYVVNGNHYPSFPWFIVGSKCKFTDNSYYQSGASQDTTNPVFKIEGDYNEIELPKIFNTNAGLVVINGNSNFIDYKTTYRDYQNTDNNEDFKSEHTNIKDTGLGNRIKYHDSNTNTTVEVVGESVISQGVFTNKIPANDDPQKSPHWSSDGLTIQNIDIALPTGRTNPKPFAKYTLTSATGNRRAYYLTTEVIVSVAGVYTLSAMVYVPTSSSAELRLAPSLNTLYSVARSDRWRYVRVREWFDVGNYLVPTFQMLGAVGDVFYVGEISVCQGENSAYGTYNRAINNPISGNINNDLVFTARSGDAIASKIVGKMFSLTVQDQTNDNFYYGIGSWQGGVPVLVKISNLIIDIVATNSSGTIALSGTTNFIITVKAI